jgi:SPP1 gp7 family putative phage head morphogenesis protein
MASVNEQLLDAETLHQVRLERLKNGIARRMIAILNRSDARLFAELQIQLEKMPASEFSVRRLDSLLKSVREINSAAFAELNESLDGELKALTAYEAGFQERTIKAAIPVEIALATVTPEVVYTAAMARPFQGVLLKDVLKNVEADKAIRIRNSLRMGYLEGKTIAQMVKEIKGTKQLGYKDGLLNPNRNNVEAIVRTATAHFASFTQQSYFEANSDIIKGEQYLAVLDSRTTPLCQSLSGKVYQIGKGPYPPQHWNCRSVRIPITKSYRELGFPIDEIPKSTQASLNGQVPSEWNYNDWLKRQSKSIQEEVLGVERARLYRNNEISVDRFVNNKGQYYTLDDLRKVESSLFE